MRFAGKRVKRWWLIAAGVVTAMVLGAGVAASATGVFDNESGLSGPDADRAREAAVREVAGGIANSVELDDERGATYEVEVTRPDGVTVDIRLDKDFRVVVVEPDSETPDRDGDGGR